MSQKQKLVAYFSPEYGIGPDLPIYSGGLGVLAADYLRAAGELGKNTVAVGVAYRYGFASSQAELEHPTEYSPAEAGYELLKEDGEKLLLEVQVCDHSVTFQIWHKQYGSTNHYLLDSHIEQNSLAQQQFSGFLYGNDHVTRIYREAFLGFAGIELFNYLDLEPEVYHLNEGHSAFVALALLIQEANRDQEANYKTLLQRTKQQIVGTKHTILTVSGLYISQDIFRHLFGDLLDSCQFDLQRVFDLGANTENPGEFSTTAFMIRMSRKVNGVSKLHVKRENRRNEIGLTPITNGVYLPRWQHQEFSGELDSQTMWQRHMACKQTMLEEVSNRSQTPLDPQALTIVWARRIAAYKQPLFLFTDLERLSALISRKQTPVNIIVAGEANVGDKQGLKMSQQLQRITTASQLSDRVVYLDDYNLTLAPLLVQGADLWLNTPKKGYEACGTSGMKAASNGVLQCSVSDGWVDEVDLEEIGWEISDNDPKSLYRVLEEEVVSDFYTRPEAWIGKMQAACSLVEDQFSAKRMVADYYQKMYFPQ